MKAGCSDAESMCQNESERILKKEFKWAVWGHGGGECQELLLIEE